MEIEINQEVLCEYCKGVNEIPSNGMCEGSHCKETLDGYMEDHGITEDKTSFSAVKFGDSLYIIKDDSLFKAEIDSVTVTRESIKFCFEHDDLNYSVLVKHTAKEDCDGTKQIFIDESDAVKKYESLMAEKIIAMAKNLAEFK